VASGSSGLSFPPTVPISPCCIDAGTLGLLQVRHRAAAATPGLLCRRTWKPYVRM
jgi:hypothetical protein